jgi:hypothetical protein
VLYRARGSGLGQPDTRLITIGELDPVCLEGGPNFSYGVAPSTQFAIGGFEPDDSFADRIINGHRETWPIRSGRFRPWLKRKHYEATGEAADCAAISSAVKCCARASAWAACFCTSPRDFESAAAAQGIAFAGERAVEVREQADILGGSKVEPGIDAPRLTRGQRAADMKSKPGATMNDGLIVRSGSNSCIHERRSHDVSGLPPGMIACESNCVPRNRGSESTVRPAKLRPMTLGRPFALLSV